MRNSARDLFARSMYGVTISVLSQGPNLAANLDRIASLDVAGRDPFRNAISRPYVMRCPGARSLAEAPVFLAVICQPVCGQVLGRPQGDGVCWPCRRSGNKGDDDGNGAANEVSRDGR